MSSTAIWTTIIGLGLGSYLLRLSFLGLIGNRAMPDWLLRHLRYTAVAFLPALVVPIVSVSDQGSADIAGIVAASATLVASVLTRNVFAAVIAGGSVYLALLWVAG